MLSGYVGFGRQNARLLLIAACLIHLSVVGGLAITNLPLVDEGFYGIPAYTLTSAGKLQNHVMESAGVPYLTGIDRVFYWMVPLGMVLQAAAFKVFGFSIFTQRALSVSCGIGTLLAWLSALFAIWLAFLWERQTALTKALAALQVLISLLALGSSAVNIRSENYQRQYLPLISFLNSHVHPNDIVFGRTELFYKLNCRACLRDDVYLGAITKRQADFIVLDTDHMKQIAKIGAMDKASLAYIRNLLARGGYVEVFHDRAYQVIENPGVSSRKHQSSGEFSR